MNDRARMPGTLRMSMIYMHAPCAVQFCDQLHLPSLLQLHDGGCKLGGGLGEL
eukprot:CAMPEP_0174292568 /NCGR_PEP_ID=MMETSP0809-20121228/35875_1 /TAXON_ID=73025 ORGANISM="Eutreptiella gymnastica-like, Strain CCMP1594" /NCGR_SAMPLE_ID=MMETSP0809 /ASSEMBLY_ACC=CAM_ASM_000658 /LENGTH=52 /DNA_ID=CAMNT_0015392729 /DNA_START=20 /DNA_END=175 /DNA_ORIENTATION=+